MDLGYADLEDASLFSASFRESELTRAHLMDADLTGAYFWGATLTAANLSGWDFAGKNLTGGHFRYTILRAADLSGTNLTDAHFYRSTLTDADLSLSDLRGSNIGISSAASSEGAILPDGRIEGLALDASERLVVRDYDPSETPWMPEPLSSIPITVESGMTLDPGATLRMLFEDDDWGSTISFEPDIDVSLGGTLELLFADDVGPADLIGTTFRLFDWDGAIVSGRFDEPIVTAPGAIWDTTNLYTTGEVTLVPEPSTLILLLITLVACALRACLKGVRSNPIHRVFPPKWLF